MMAGDAADPGPLPPLRVIPDDLRTLVDYERHAEAHMTPDIWRHVQQGAGGETTLAANRDQFAAVRLVPAKLRDMRGATTAVDLFGRRHAAPVLLAPVAYQALAHPEGELAMAAAAVALDTCMVVSTLSSFTLEAIADRACAAALELGAAPPPMWFQLYLQPSQEDNETLVRRAEAAGYGALVLTVDAGAKQAGLQLPRGVGAANLAGLPRSVHETGTGGRLLFGSSLVERAPTWASLDWLRKATRLPVIVKGLLAPDDVRIAAERGADGVILSNHGGRVIDGLATPLDMLPHAIAATRAGLPILIDGGVRHGTDVARALALGAQAVLVGRPQMHALAVAGIAGAAHMLQILRTELELAMFQLGCREVADFAATEVVRPGAGIG